MKAILASFALLSLTLASACHKEGPAAATPTPAASSDPAAPAAAGDALTCQTDADCVVSCARASECCDQLCPPCAQAFNHTSLDALMKWRGESCAAVSCPMAKCMAPKEETSAKCEAGQCTVVRTPAANP